MWHYLTKYEKVSMSSLKCEYISSYGQRRNISFLKTAHWYGLNFLYFFIRPENLKISENLDALTFLREKVSPFVKSKWYMYTLWLLITLCNMLKGLVTQLQGKQHLCVHMLYESLVGQCEYKTQPKGFFWCHVIDTNGAILLAIFLNKFVLVLFNSHSGIW